VADLRRTVSSRGCCSSRGEMGMAPPLVVGGSCYALCLRGVARAYRGGKIDDAGLNQAVQVSCKNALICADRHASLICLAPLIQSSPPVLLTCTGSRHNSVAALKREDAAPSGPPRSQPLRAAEAFKEPRGFDTNHEYRCKRDPASAAPPRPTTPVSRGSSRGARRDTWNWQPGR